MCLSDRRESPTSHYIRNYQASIYSTDIDYSVQDTRQREAHFLETVITNGEGNMSQTK